MFRILIVVLPIVDLLWWWWADRRLRPLRHARWWRAGLAGFMLTMLGGFASVILIRRMNTPGLTNIPEAIVAAAYVWHLLVMPVLLLILLGSGIGTLVSRVIDLFRRPSPEPSPDPNGEAAERPTLTRRQVLGAAVAAAPVVLTGGAVIRSLSQLDEFRIRPLEVPLRGLPRGLDGMTIAHVTDAHVGKFTNGALLRSIADAVNNLRADLVLLTGDLIDFSMSDLPDALEMVRAIDPRHGLAMCEGNHDLFDGRELFHQRVRAAGVPLLVDETTTFRVRGHDVQVLGLQWGPRRGGGPRVIDSSMAKLGTMINPDALPILLAHHPHAFDRAADYGIPLTLAGHTHGGQLNLTDEIGVGKAMFKYVSGLYRQRDSALVVSNGVGNWFPIRINAPAELVHITLRAI